MAKTVLIVEDVADIRLMMKMLVTSYGYRVLTANDGYEALEKFKEYHPDLILMDLMMPVLDGVMATKIIRDLGEDKVPILAVTAYDTLYQQRAIEAGCDDVIPKPVDFERLKPLLGQYLA
jgi:CheY-like chemotaxis protein